MGENENGTEEWRMAGEAAPDPSLERPARHTFILRLIPDMRGQPTEPPRWRGELEHSSCGKKSEPQHFNSVGAMLANVKRVVGSITK